MSAALARGALLPLALLLLGGCTAHGRIRTEAGAVSTSVDRLATAGGRRDAERHSVEVHPGFTVVFVEFDDQGRFWDRAQVELLERTLEEEARRPGYDGVLISVFAHGWKHDCSVCDPNVACFRTFLGRIVKDGEAVTRLSNGAVAPHRVVGIYVGWRGRSATNPLQELTFFARKRVALRIGSGDLVELLTRVDLFVTRQNAAGPNRARMVTMGHSLGGTMIYTALANILKVRVLESLTRKGGSGGPPVIEGFGDLVVLINPAFEASLYRSLHELTRSFERFSPLQTPVLITIASETDSANGTWFPFGRGLETLWERTADETESRSLRTAVGHYDDFVGYRLTAAHPGRRPDAARGPEDESAAAGCGCALDLVSPGVDQLRTAAELITAGPGPAGTPEACDALPKYGRATLRCVGDVDTANPFWVVRASDDVVHGHGGFFTNESIDFIRFVVARALGKRSIRTALAARLEPGGGGR